MLTFSWQWFGNCSQNKKLPQYFNFLLYKLNFCCGNSIHNILYYKYICMGNGNSFVVNSYPLQNWLSSPVLHICASYTANFSPIKSIGNPHIAQTCIWILWGLLSPFYLPCRKLIFVRLQISFACWLYFFASLRIITPCKKLL